jgi:putative copper resistance protein D
MALGVSAWAGHAGAADPRPWLAAAIDALHAVAVGAWLGGLLSLAGLLRDAARPAGADSRPYAVLAAGRFSALAGGAMAVIAATGAWNAWTQIGTVPALLGTPYGRLLLLKLALLVPIITLAAVNRRRFLPALAGDADTVGRAAMRRLRFSIGIESAAALALLAIVALMGLTTPARHVEPSWPFAFRLSYGATANLPGVTGRVAVGGVVAILSLAVALAGMLRHRPRAACLTAVLGVATGLGVALPPLVVDAYPTTYRRPPVPFHARSITAGADRYRDTCVPCHDPGAADLAGGNVTRHTAGDLYWWLTVGIPRAPMPGFAARLSEEERWDLVNFLRAREAARAALGLGPSVEMGLAQIVAPDFAYAIGPTPPQSLRDHRGRRHVLLVLFTLPDSRHRLMHLAQAYDALVSMGGEIVAVPMGQAPDVLKRLGAESRIFFPVVTEGAPEIIRTYWLFTVPGQALRHVEFLIDRQGYLRARAQTPPGSLPGLSSLLTQLEKLNQEPQTLEPPDEHVH